MPEPLFPTGRDRHDGGDDRAERVLRRVLHTQASAVDPGVAPRVGDLLDRSRPRRWPAALGVAAAVVALAVTSAVALRPGTPPAPVAAPSASASPSASPSASAGDDATTGPSSAPSAPAPSATGTPTGPEPSARPSDVPPVTRSPSPSTEQPDCPVVEAPALLWSVVEQATGEGTALRVVPDRGRVPVLDEQGCTGDPGDPEALVRGAVAALLGSEAPDPDHTNLWRQDGEGAADAAPAVEVTGSGTTVDLPAAAFGGQVGSEAAAMAVAAMVRTVVSNGGTAPVTLLVDGEAGAEVWGALVLGTPLSPGTQELASGWILDPYDGQRVRAGTVTLSGTAIAFEASVSWAVRDADGATVAEGATQAGSMGAYGPWTVPVELSPGTYTAVLRAENIAGPAEGPGPWLWEDTKTFTVVP